MREGGGVKGVVVDSSVLFSSVAENASNGCLLPAAQLLLRRLCYSSLRIGIALGSGLSAQQENILKTTATQCSFDCFILHSSPVNVALHEVTMRWGLSVGNILFFVSYHNEQLFQKLKGHGFSVIALGSEDAGPQEESNIRIISRIEEFPLRLCCLNKKAISTDTIIVGYTMKASREEDFSKRGAFPMYPTENGLIFMPLMFDLPIPSQLQEVDIVLHKATDEIVSIELSNSSESSNKVTYSRGMQELERYVERHPECCIIDPLKSIFPVLDRIKIQQVLGGLAELRVPGHHTVRGPHFIKVDNFDNLDLEQRLLEAKLSLPSMVKPQVACGVADAHNMAIVFRVEDFKDLQVPLPAIVQEYVDHSSTIFKFYVLGEKVFYAVKKSIPNADVLIKLYEDKGHRPILFDSLKSLPTARESQQPGIGVQSKSNDESIDLEVVACAATLLRKLLDLTIFGFDVVIQEGSGDYVIVDVNYLPSFKEVPDNVAIPAFWDAIYSSYDSRRRNQATSV